MQSFEKDMAVARELALRAEAAGGRAYFVGGIVRDALMGIEGKDVDVEIHGLVPSKLEEILDSMGQRMSFGESFGIYALKGCGVDIALPRKEKARGMGHRDFDVFADPFAGTRSAAQRRDFTINAMMQDVLSGEIVDHFGGREDLKRGVIRHVSASSFPEDPLRVLRAAQFAARFGFSVARDTLELCSDMGIWMLPGERVEQELKKALLRAERPSVFFEVLRAMGQLGHWFPELEALIGVPQNPKYHAEGDVWTHTMLVLDEAAGLKCRAADPFGFMLAALMHDLGKARCTKEINGVLHAYGHEELGAAPTEQLLRRLGCSRRLQEYVTCLVALHMKPNVLARAGAAIRSTNKMFDQASDPEALIALAAADSLGKRPVSPTADEFLLQRLEIYREYMARPYVMGKDLVAAGLEPGEDFASFLAFAHKLRLAGVEKENALKQTLAMAAKARSKKERGNSVEG